MHTSSMRLLSTLNSLFLVYVAILGLSFYTFFGSMIRLHLDSLQPYFAAKYTEQDR